MSDRSSQDCSGPIGTTRPKIVVWGASGHAAVVADAIQQCGDYELLGLLDDVSPQREGEIVSGVPVLGGEQRLKELSAEGATAVIVGIGVASVRCELSRRAERLGLDLVSVIHPSAVVAPDVGIGEGTFIGPGAIVNVGAQLGRNVIVNSGAIVEHHCRLEEGVHVAPGARLAGRVHIQAMSWIGIGATVIEEITVGANSLVGAGAVVVRDIEANTVAFGVPAKARRRQEGSRES